MISTNVVSLGILNQLPNLGLLQMVEVVVVGGSQIRAHAAVMARDDHTATAGGVLRVDAVLDTQTGLLDGIMKDSGVLVVAHTTDVDHAVGRQDILCTTGGVLRGTAGQQLRLVVVQEILVEAEMLLLGENGIVGFETILLEQLLVAEGLDVLNWAVSLGAYQGYGEEGLAPEGQLGWLWDLCSVDATHLGEDSPDRAGGSPWKCSSCSMGVSWTL